MGVAGSGPLSGSVVIAEGEVWSGAWRRASPVRCASCGGVRGVGEGERLASVVGKGKPGGMLWRAAMLLGVSCAVGSMRYCPGRPGPVGTNWRSRRA